MQKAKDIMTPNPRCCIMESSVWDAVEVMRKENCGIVPILDQEGQCIGVVTDRDLCLNVILNRLNPDSTPLQEVMTRNLVTCYPEESMDDVLHKMEQRMVRRILVVNDNNRCIGIISEADIALKGEGKIKVSELVEAVSQ